MKSKNIYSYRILRYFHDVASGEFINLGVILYCDELKFFRCAMKKSQKRITCFFPNAKGRGLIRYLKKLEANINGRGDHIGSALISDIFENKSESVLGLSGDFLPHDDSSLQWSKVEFGLTSNPSVTLQRLFDRYVSRYDESRVVESRTNDEVWQKFSRVLENRSLSGYLQECEVRSEVDSVKFEHALKNGKWHMLEPVSFDLTDGDSIKRKARQILGEMIILQDSEVDFDVYFLVGEPKRDDVRKDYDVAIKTLEMMPKSIGRYIYTESDIQEFEMHISKVMEHH